LKYQTANQKSSKRSIPIDQIILDEYELEIQLRERSRTHPFHPKCLLHSFDSWKQGAVENNLRNIENNQMNPPEYQFNRSETQINPSGWVQCERCRHYVCEVCLQAIIHVLPSVYGIQNFVGNKWCQMISAFCEVQYDHQLFHKIMHMPGILSHCCGLKICAKKQTARDNEAIIQYLSTYSDKKTNDHKFSLDRLLHYSPYRAMFAPSSRYYDCLAAAEQATLSSCFYQKPVFHSVLGNRVAHEYEGKNIRPIVYTIGSEASIALVIDDRVYDVESGIINKSSKNTKTFVRKQLTV
jgi:hypothetical protein